MKTSEALAEFRASYQDFVSILYGQLAYAFSLNSHICSFREEAVVEKLAADDAAVTCHACAICMSCAQGGCVMSTRLYHNSSPF